MDLNLLKNKKKSNLEMQVIQDILINMTFHSSDMIWQENKKIFLAIFMGFSSTSTDIYRLDLLHLLRKTIVLQIIK